MNATLVTTLLQHWVDSGVIVGVVVIKAVFGFIQESKAERALDTIPNMLSHEATVLRGGHQISLPAEQLMPEGFIFTVHSSEPPRP